MKVVDSCLFLRLCSFISLCCIFQRMCVFLLVVGMLLIFRLESHCPEFAEAAGRLVERLRLKAADVEQKEVVATNHTKSNTSSKNASNNEPGETHKALPHARCALEEAIESAPKTVLLAYLNGIHQLLPVTDETVSHDSPVEVRSLKFVFGVAMLMLEHDEKDQAWWQKSAKLVAGIRNSFLSHDTLDVLWGAAIT